MASLRRIIKTFSASLDLGLPAITGDVLVVGSAPGSRPPSGALDGFTLMTVNASQVLAESWGFGVPDFTIIRPQIVNDRHESIKAREVLADRSTKIAIVAGWKEDRSAFETILREMGYGWQALALVTEWQKHRVMFQTARVPSAFEIGKLNISNGVLGAGLSLFLGASRVVMAGVSLSKDGHAYDEHITKRLHIDDDRRVLNALSKRTGKVFAAEPALAGECGIPLWPSA
ncbi:hypothetical protein [Mesorhizobium loti]|uniref:Membrane-anchored protein n=1 Tax=Mesorhizobium loti R88b TaxID=935548 RepID=A0A6M7W9J3_RHILI|nr:hypothetical protein [Mesorhizobium loti]QKD00330.1 hypothetical protein EB235_01635 [Mesorhizobium loti R88b]